jgi:Cyclin, N-terminal domain/Cyclin, C-terminal domain
MDLHQSESTLETIHAMLGQEANGYLISCDYLASGPTTRGCLTRQIDADCRSKMAAWCYQVVDFCHFDRESVAIAMNFLDRFLATTTGRPLLYDRAHYQLAAMTALYTSIKLNEPEAIDPQTVSDLSKGAYSACEVEEMERVMLHALHWRVNPPTAMSFVRHLIALLPTITTVPHVYRTAVHDIAKFQTELAVTDHDFIVVPPSVVAYCAVLNALEALHFLDGKVRSCIGFSLARAMQMDVVLATSNLQTVQARLFAAVLQSDAVVTSTATLATTTATDADCTLSKPAARRCSLESPRSTLV